MAITLEQFNATIGNEKNISAINGLLSSKFTKSTLSNSINLTNAYLNDKGAKKFFSVLWYSTTTLTSVSMLVFCHPFITIRILSFRLSVKKAFKLNEPGAAPNSVLSDKEFYIFLGLKVAAHPPIWNLLKTLSNHMDKIVNIGASIGAKNLHESDAAEDENLAFSNIRTQFSEPSQSLKNLLDNLSPVGASSLFNDLIPVVAKIKEANWVEIIKGIMVILKSANNQQLLDTTVNDLVTMLPTLLPFMPEKYREVANSLIKNSTDKELVAAVKAIYIVLENLEDRVKLDELYTKIEAKAYDKAVEPIIEILAGILDKEEVKLVIAKLASNEAVLKLAIEFIIDALAEIEIKKATEEGKEKSTTTEEFKLSDERILEIREEVSSKIQPIISIIIPLLSSEQSPTPNLIGLIQKTANVLNVYSAIEINGEGSTLEDKPHENKLVALAKSALAYLDSKDEDVTLTSLIIQADPILVDLLKSPEVAKGINDLIGNDALFDTAVKIYIDILEKNIEQKESSILQGIEGSSTTQPTTDTKEKLESLKTLIAIIKPLIASNKSLIPSIIKLVHTLLESGFPMQIGDGPSDKEKLIQAALVYKNSPQEKSDFNTLVLITAPILKNLIATDEVIEALKSILASNVLIDAGAELLKPKPKKNEKVGASVKGKEKESESSTKVQTLNDKLIPVIIDILKDHSIVENLLKIPKLLEIITDEEVVLLSEAGLEIDDILNDEKKLLKLIDDLLPIIQKIANLSEFKQILSKLLSNNQLIALIELSNVNNTILKDILLDDQKLEIISKVLSLVDKILTESLSIMVEPDKAKASVTVGKEKADESDLTLKYGISKIVEGVFQLINTKPENDEKTKIPLIMVEPNFKVVKSIFNISAALDILKNLLVNMNKIDGINKIIISLSPHYGILINDLFIDNVFGLITSILNVNSIKIKDITKLVEIYNSSEIQVYLFNKDENFTPKIPFNAIKELLPIVHKILSDEMVKSSLNVLINNTSLDAFIKAFFGEKSKAYTNFLWAKSKISNILELTSILNEPYINKINELLDILNTWQDERAVENTDKSNVDKRNLKIVANFLLTDNALIHWLGKNNNIIADLIQTNPMIEKLIPFNLKGLPNVINEISALIPTLITNEEKPYLDTIIDNFVDQSPALFDSIFTASPIPKVAEETSKQNGQSSILSPLTEMANVKEGDDIGSYESDLTDLETQTTGEESDLFHSITDNVVELPDYAKNIKVAGLQLAASILNKKEHKASLNKIVNLALKDLTIKSNDSLSDDSDEKEKSYIAFNNKIKNIGRKVLPLGQALLEKDELLILATLYTQLLALDGKADEKVDNVAENWDMASIRLDLDSYKAARKEILKKLINEVTNLLKNNKLKGNIKDNKDNILDVLQGFALSPKVIKIIESWGITLEPLFDIIINDPNKLSGIAERLINLILDSENHGYLTIIQTGIGAAYNFAGDAATLLRNSSYVSADVLPIILNVKRNNNLDKNNLSDLVNQYLAANSSAKLSHKAMIKHATFNNCSYNELKFEDLIVDEFEHNTYFSMSNSTIKNLEFNNSIVNKFDASSCDINQLIIKNSVINQCNFKRSTINSLTLENVTIDAQTFLELLISAQGKKINIKNLKIVGDFQGVEEKKLKSLILSNVTDLKEIANAPTENSHLQKEDLIYNKIFEPYTKDNTPQSLAVKLATGTFDALNPPKVHNHEYIAFVELLEGVFDEFSDEKKLSIGSNASTYVGGVKRSVSYWYSDSYTGLLSIYNTLSPDITSTKPETDFKTTIETYFQNKFKQIENEKSNKPDEEKRNELKSK